MVKILMTISKRCLRTSPVSLGEYVQKKMVRASSLSPLFMPSLLIWSDHVPRPHRHPESPSQDDSENS